MCGGAGGWGVLQAIHRRGALMASRLGVQLRIAKIAVQDPNKLRPVKVPPALLTTDWRSVVADPSINLIGEFIGRATTTPPAPSAPFPPPPTLLPTPQHPSPA